MSAILRFRLFPAILIAAAVPAADAAPFEATVTDVAPAPVVITCQDPGGWRFSVTRRAGDEKGVGIVEIALAAPTSSVPPAFTVGVTLPQRDSAYLWRAASTGCGLMPDWNSPLVSHLPQWLPLYAYFSEDGRNRLTIATDEAKREVRFRGGLREEGSLLPVRFSFFPRQESPISSYVVRVRFDARDGFYADAVREASDWISASAGLKPAAVPEAAFEPLYSTWYCFHQDVTDKAVEAECALAAKLGMKVLIVDDGWQTDDTNRGYAYCGDWQVSTNRFPDMAAHVRRVQALGMKYMVWYSVPFVGRKSANYARFRGKFLSENDGLETAVLDPRFPDVREFLIGIYEKALREWNLDGFKLDFIDSFRGGPEAKAGDGRDIASVTEAVDRLMKDVSGRLRAIRPDVLVEFRQAYVGPAIRQYGNMFRVSDCPGNYLANRTGIARLRLTSGTAAVHADMLEWHPSARAEDAARYVLNCLFGTIQYSMMLRTLPSEHLEMIRHWLDFTRRHRGALLKGTFRPHHPELSYPLLEGADATERVIGVYAEALTVSVPADGRTTYVVNASASDTLVLDLAAAPSAVEAFDTFGRPVAVTRPEKGLRRVPCPVSGYLRIR